MTGQSTHDLLAGAAAVASSCAERAGVRLRPLETLDQMQAACTLLDRVWDIGPDQPPECQPHLLRALAHGGNYLAGAYAPDDELIGASVCFFTEPLGAAMHSHITGVLAGAAGHGVGAAIKWHQRLWALERGLTRITWTFDPLIARNAYFNLAALGATAETYYVDFYGAMHDGPNRGQPTDRVQVGWDLPAVEPAVGRVDGRAAADGQVLLAVDPAGGPITGGPPRADAETVLLGIPADIEAMRRDDPSLALAWRQELRAALALLMADKSWQVSGFDRGGWYVLNRRSTSPYHPDQLGADRC